MAICGLHGENRVVMGPAMSGLTKIHVIHKQLR